MWHSIPGWPPAARCGCRRDAAPADRRRFSPAPSRPASHPRRESRRWLDFPAAATARHRSNPLLSSRAPALRAPSCAIARAVWREKAAPPRAPLIAPRKKAQPSARSCRCCRQAADASQSGGRVRRPGRQIPAAAPAGQGGAAAGAPAPGRHSRLLQQQRFAALLHHPIMTSRRSRNRVARLGSGQITSTVSSPAMVPTTSGQSSPSIARATGCAVPLVVITTSWLMRLLHAQREAAQHLGGLWQVVVLVGCAIRHRVAVRTFIEMQLVDIARQRRLGHFETALDQAAAQLVLAADGRACDEFPNRTVPVCFIPLFLPLPSKLGLFLGAKSERGRWPRSVCIKIHSHV